MNATTVTTSSPANKKPLIAVVGATGVGKTSAAIRLARLVDGEVISADSRYLYRGMDIGTATPTEEEMAGIPHHLINILNPADDYSLTLFQRDALRAIDDVHSRGRLPILAGGTPLYVNALLEGWRIPEVQPDPAFRAAMEAVVRDLGAAELHGRLEGVDPVAAARIPAANVRRVIRALEIERHTGRPMTDIEGKEPPPFRVLLIGLTMPREELYLRVDERIDRLIASGFVEEVRRLLHEGVSPEARSMSAIGYPELVAYIQGRATLAEAVERMKFHTHRYVRHQSTWLKRMDSVQWIDPREESWFDQIARLVYEFLAT
ncbi:MAG TPA: tRNA (adenosine(37)-N6)-dimethylallyltransferase MiaA [Nitrolancea sp.]|nr:tRNA (adenosine(37)-N6)-dimethylallyltransferase MiaA [Nitrolancea sp.]